VRERVVGERIRERKDKTSSGEINHRDNEFGTPKIADE
jgi:hypothetical protein